MLPLIVVLFIVSDEVFKKTPPPLPVVVFAVKVQLLSVTEPPLLERPPPFNDVHWLSRTTTSVSVRFVLTLLIPGPLATTP